MDERDKRRSAPPPVRGARDESEDPTILSGAGDGDRPEDEDDAEAPTLLSRSAAGGAPPDDEDPEAPTVLSGSAAGGDSGSLGPTILPGSSPGADLHPSIGPPPEQIGPYRLLQKVGEGGMGEVWEAEQVEPVRRKVALKLIKRGMDSREVIARFEAERQALAMMDHPCIARVFDAGATPRGRPYFVMEFVKGIPLTEHCDRNRLSTRERLELFISICEGVQHAHQKAILHRDLKPSNVLITVQDGKALPKIIDFGLAKATAQPLTERTMHTQLGQILGTPEYMSPEQAEMTDLNIDTRTDVYSRGVILYQLLSGALPFDARELRRAGFDELRRLIREVDPPRPSTRLSQRGDASSVAAERRGTDVYTLTSQVRGDLDWIVMKALEKDRTRRYGSPFQLVEDIRRHLAFEPVLARPPSATYRMQKFVRRHTVGVLSASVLLLLLVAFAATMAVQAGRIARERDRANEEAETARQVSAFLRDLFTVSDPSESLGNTITAREILDKGAVRIEQELGDQPAVQARLMDTMGDVYRRLGLYDAAQPLLESALERLRGEGGGTPLEIASTEEDLGMLYERTGDYDRARELYEASLATREAELGPSHPDVASALNNLGNLVMREGDLEGARELYERSLRIREKVLGPDHVDLARTLNNLGVLLIQMEEYEDALIALQRTLEIRSKALGENHTDLAQSLNNLAIVHRYLGNFEHARRLYQRALEIRETALGSEHHLVSESYYNLASVAALQGNRRTALDLLHLVVERGYANSQMLDDEDLASLAGDPEFEEILDRVREMLLAGG
jgi:non-specific serine/threonine protein kinase/serine/threonine-protein kinase